MPLRNIDEDSTMKEDASAPQTNLIASSPFVRNQNFVRKGIRPQSSPAEIEWTKVNVIKSKEEELKPNVKTMEAMPSCLPNIIKKKDPEHVDFANPSYQQHLELAEFMNKLDSKSAAERIVIGSEGNYNEPMETNTLSGIQVLGSHQTSNLEDGAKVVLDIPQKKKRVLKIKKKKKEDKKNKNSISEVKNNELIDDVEGSTFQNKNSNKDYENIENFNNFESVSEATTDKEKVYDNNNLCKVLHPDVDVEHSIYERIPTNEQQGGEPEDKTNPLFVTATSNLRPNVSSSSPDVNVTENSANVYLDIRSNLKKGRSTGNVTEIAKDKVMPSETVQSYGSNSPSQNRRFSPNIKNTSNTTNSYLDIRSNLRKGRSTENLTEGAQDKVNSEETGQAYSTVRAKLHKTNTTVTTTNSSTEEIKSPPESSSENKSSSDSSSENKSFSESSVIELSQDNNKKMLTGPTENDCCTTAHYPDMRAQLHKTNRNLTDIESNIFTKNSQSTKSIETSNELSGKRDKALSPEETFVNMRMSLHPTGLLERELDNRRKQTRIVYKSVTIFAFQN